MSCELKPGTYECEIIDSYVVVDDNGDCSITRRFKLLNLPCKNMVFMQSESLTQNTLEETKGV
jgi:hypothetical protein